MADLERTRKRGITPWPRLPPPPPPRSPLTTGRGREDLAAGRTAGANETAHVLDDAQHRQARLPAAAAAAAAEAAAPPRSPTRRARVTAQQAAGATAAAAHWRIHRGGWPGPAHLQKLSSLRTSAMATSCGVVITIAPSTPLVSRSSCTMLMCSSDVPGGAAHARGRTQSRKQPPQRRR